MRLWPDVLFTLNFDPFYPTDYNLTAQQTTDKKEGTSDEANEETILNENQSGKRESYEDDQEYDGNISGLNMNEENI